MQMRHQFDYDTYTVLISYYIKKTFIHLKDYDQEDDATLRQVLEQSMKEYQMSS